MGIMGIVETFRGLFQEMKGPPPRSDWVKNGLRRCPLCDALMLHPPLEKGSDRWMLDPPIVEASFSGTGGLGVTYCYKPVCGNCVEKAREIDAKNRAMMPAAYKAAGLT